MSFSTVKKQPKSVREPFKSTTKKLKGNLPTTLEKTVRRGTMRGSSLVKINNDVENEQNSNPYSQTATSKSSSKPNFSGINKGSNSSVRPKRISYGLHVDQNLAPINHDIAKQKLETLFVNKGVK